MKIRHVLSGFMFLAMSADVIGQCNPYNATGPTIVVTAGSYYPAVWNGPVPYWWDSWAGITPAPEPIDWKQDFQRWFNSLFKLATLQNPAALVKIGPNAPTHIAARHLYNSPGDGSKFNEKYSDPRSLLLLAAYGVANTVPKPGNTPGELNYTLNFPDFIGNEFGNPTSTYTVKVFNTNTIEDGMPVYFITNMYPGSP